MLKSCTKVSENFLKRVYNYEMDFNTIRSAKTYGLVILIISSMYFIVQLLFPGLFFDMGLSFALIASAANVVLAWSYVKFLTGVQVVIGDTDVHNPFSSFAIYKLVVVLSALSAAFILPIGIYVGGEMYELAQSMYVGILFILGAGSVIAAGALKKYEDVIANDAQIASWSLRITGLLFSFVWFFESAMPAMFTALIAYFFMWRMVNSKLKSAQK